MGSQRGLSIEIPDTSRRPSDHAATDNPVSMTHSLSGRDKLVRQTTRSVGNPTMNADQFPVS